MISYDDKPWVKNYDPGVKASYKPYPEHSVQQYLIDFAKQYPNRPLVLTTAKLPVLGRQTATLTYQQVNDASDALAVGLIKMGVQKGDRVVIVMPNIAQFVIAGFAVLKAGGVLVATNPTYPRDKMLHQIKDAGAKVVITMSLFYNIIADMEKEAGLEQIIVANVKEYLPPIARILFSIAKEKKEGHAIEKKAHHVWFQDILKQYQNQKPNVQVGKDDLAFFQYTGGTTGVSKGAMATHGGLVANATMISGWVFAGQPSEEEIFFAAIPMFHVFGMVAVLISTVSIASRMVLIPNPRDMDEVVECVDFYKPTLFPGVPALYSSINNHAGVKSGQYKLNSIKYCFSGSAPLPPTTKLEFERLSGGSLVEGFGMSEAPTATHANPMRGENRTGSVGLPFPDMEMKICNIDDPDEIVPPGEVGELAMHGPQVMKGYHNMPTETQNVLRADQNGKLWLYTGDIARMDEEGYFYIVDRKKDMALIGGYNVYPRAVEDVLMEHPAVREVGVAAIPHPEKEGQEALKAWIVLHDGKTATDKDLIDYCGTKLARYEVPTRYAFVDELPRTTVGKVLRRELARMEMEAREKASSS